jgi:hypothetical protein
MICTERFDIKVVAAAFLIAKGELHVEELTSMILRSELSTLGLKGKTPPRQTVTSILSSHPDSFYNEPRGSGCWGVWNPDEVERDSDVLQCRRLIEERGL